MGLLLLRAFLVINIFNIATENPVTPKPYRFPVYLVNECPRSENEFKTAAQRRNCTKGLRYLCAPNKYISSLIEFCTDRPRSLYEKGNCVLLEGTGDLDHYSCVEKFNSSCPSEYYYDEEIYKYPACLEIYKEHRCFVADNDCNKREFPTAETHLNISKMETIGNETFRKASPKLLAIVYIIAVVSSGMILIWVIFRKRRKDESTDTDDSADSDISTTSEESDGDNANDKKITHMYQTVLNHKYPDGKWEKAMTTYLVWNIDGYEDYKIIKNDRKGARNKHAEMCLINEIEIEVISEAVRKTLMSKCKETGGPKLLCIMIYINNSPCSDCTKTLITFLEKYKQVSLRFYVTNLYNIRRKSCKSSNEDHINKVKESDHKANSKGLKNLMQHKRCDIMAFTKDVWEKLLHIVAVSKRCKKQLLNNYDKKIKGNDRSRKDEDEYIKEDLEDLEVSCM